MEEGASSTASESKELQSPVQSGDNNENSGEGDGEVQVENSTDTDQPTKKARLSKAAKRQLKMERWEANKKIRRKLEREKRKNARRSIPRKVLKSQTMESSSCKLRVAIDLSFDEHMSEKDIGKCMKQIHRCYSVNRREPNPLQFFVTSFNGLTAKAVAKNQGYDNWDVNFREEPYHTVFDKESIIYLTSESENVIEHLDESKVLIIGGLVDHNSKKGLCHQLAVEKGINHARLPIDKFLEMKTRVVLTIDHVFEIIVNVSKGLSWQDSLLQVIPARKNAAIKDVSEDDQPQVPSNCSAGTSTAETPLQLIPNPVTEEAN